MASNERNLIPEEPLSVASLVGGAVKGFLRDVQDYSMLCARTIVRTFTPPHYITDLLAQMDIVGVGSLPIVLLTGFFIGAVLVLQTAAQFVRFGETSLTGDVVAISLVRELGPTISGLLVAGRNSSGMASELGSMVVTEQVDAMRAMGTDPTRKLVVPRVVATVLVMPFLVAMADLVGLFGGFVTAYFTLRIGGDRVLDARRERPRAFRHRAGHVQAVGLWIHRCDGRLLPGAFGARRHARRRPGDDAGRRGGVGADPDFKLLPDARGSLSGRQGLSCPSRLSSSTV